MSTRNMYLYIDNSQDDKIVFIALRENAASVIREYDNKARKPLLYFFDKFLRSLKKKKSDIRGLAICSGRGRFTAARISATMANALAYALKIPVVSVTEFCEFEIFKKIKKAKVGVYASASYSAPPHIDGVQRSV